MNKNKDDKIKIKPEDFQDLIEDTEIDESQSLSEIEKIIEGQSKEPRAQ